MISRHALPLFAVGLMAFLAMEISRQPRIAAQAPAEDHVAFHIRLGVDESQPRTWNGSVRVRGGRVASLEGWQFDEGDEIVSASEWKCATVVEEYWYAPWERSLHSTKRHDKLTEKGVVLQLAMDGPGTIEVETTQGAFSFEPAGIAWDRPESFLGGKAVVSRAPAIQKITDDALAEDYVASLTASDGGAWLAWQSYQTGGDQLWVRRDGDEPQALTGSGRDLFRVALAEGAGGRIWAVWSEQRDDNWDLFARGFQDGAWSEAERLTTAAAPDIFHALAADGRGRLYLAWQSPREGNYDIFLRIHEGQQWGPEIQLSDDPANDWEPAVAATGDGQAVVLWDTYSDGNYDIRMRPLRGARLEETIPLTDSAAFEARPAAMYGSDGRLWLAWEEGDASWGKDYVQGIQEAGMGLLMRRQVRVAAWENGALRQLPGDLAAGLPEEPRHVFLNPQLAADGNGNLWVFYRYRTETPQREKPASRTMWRTGASTFRQGRWSEMIRFPGGYGRIDAPTAVSRAGQGGLLVHWVSDGRAFPNGALQQQDLYAARMETGSGAGETPRLRAFQPPGDRYPPVHPNETQDVARLRSYRAEIGGSAYRIVRGDMHRHTDISWDGNRDGSLFDSYRYALDAAAHDFLGVSDHNAGADVEYSWWRIQKAADLFEIPGRFMPLYGYERSRAYPSGHRNVMFAQRGVPVFSFTEAEREDNENTSVDHLYEHLRKERGIVMAHTSATGAGTDWRDNDPEVETLVEVYQGYRRNYEHRGAPRSSSVNDRPAGYVWKAWEKGLKLGLQSSSDHVSTHASYGMIWVPEVSREAIIESIRARRSYAATDNILLDFRLNGRLMGEAFSTRERPSLEVKVHGTGPVRKVEVIRNNEYIHTQPGGAAQLEFTYVDNSSPPGESYYYVRVEQENGELAWASPIWVTRE